MPSLVSFLVGTGCRISEALAVKVGDVSQIPRAQVAIRRAITTNESGREVIGALLKSEAAVRTNALPDWLLSLLLDHISTLGLQAESFLFPAPAGALLPTRRFRARFWQPACAQAGVSVTPHDLRHLHASLLFEARRPLTEIAARLGHSSPAITMAIYAHWLADDDSGSARAIPEIKASGHAGWR